MRDGNSGLTSRLERSEIQAEHVDRLLRVHGLSLARSLDNGSRAENEARRRSLRPTTTFAF